MQVLAQRTNRAYRENAFDAERFHGVNIGAIIDFAGKNPVAAAMAREKRDALPFERANYKCVGRIAERRLHANVARAAESCHRIETAAADDSDAHWLARRAP